MPDTLMGGFWLTIIDMAVVFIVLWALALIIKAIRLTVAPFERKGGGSGDPAGNSSVRAGKPESPAESEGYAGQAVGSDDGASAELAAVISAAVAAYLGARARGAVISAAPASGEDNLWAVVGRTRIMQSRELVRRRATA